ncbi:MAG TPA: hypothetical protein PL168_08540 [Methanobacterium sp.]|nr:hypothetical protein [Methanobacterium sp.]HOI40762.1 hypothetical protein [Methanobacterium sp.]
MRDEQFTSLKKTWNPRSRTLKLDISWVKEICSNESVGKSGSDKKFH